MQLGLSDEQRALVASFAKLLGKAMTTQRVRVSEPDGFDPDLWKLLGSSGVLTMAVPENRGGWGATLLDLALVAELVGRSLAPAPVIEAQVAVRLLARVATVDALDTLRSALQGGVVTVALHPPRHGVARLVPAGALCDSIVSFDGSRLSLAAIGPPERRAVVNLAASPLADVTVQGGVELAAGAAAAEWFAVATDEWLVLTAAALVGISAAAHETACAYVSERSAFGRVVGSYQAVAHPLADDATDIDGARLLVREAAWALGRGHPRGRELAAMAFAFTSETAERATYDALHFHGGYGFTLEHDAQLFYRRARGWSRVWGDAEAGYRRAADARYGPRAEGGA